MMSSTKDTKGLPLLVLQAFYKQKVVVALQKVVAWSSWGRPSSLTRPILSLVFFQDSFHSLCLICFTQCVRRLRTRLGICIWAVVFTSLSFLGIVLALEFLPLCFSLSLLGWWVIFNQWLIFSNKLRLPILVPGWKKVVGWPPQSHLSSIEGYPKKKPYLV